MLPLPKGLQVTRDHESEKDLLVKARAYLEKGDRKGIHASDLMDCRLAFWKRVKPEPLTDRLVNMFIVGQVAHAIIEVIKGADGDYTKPDGGTKCFEDIYYSPDFMDHKGEPDEIKTTRSFYLPKATYLPDDHTYHMYIEQLMIYMAAEDKTRGRLTLLYLNAKDEDGKTKPQFFVWTVETTQKALEAFRKVILAAKTQLEDALKNKDCKELPLCREWKCGEKECQYWNDCKPPGRYGVPKKEWTV